MKSSTENMRTALNEVLLMSKQDADMRLELKRVNIHRLIEKVRRKQKALLCSLSILTHALFIV